jgi:hypothetical protein
VLVVHDLLFADEQTAARFTFRLHKNLPEDVSSFRDGRHVRIFDASERGHAARIAELTRESSGTYASPVVVHED